jgi:hypothetical protein
MDRPALRAMTVGAVRRMIQLDEHPRAPRPADYVQYSLWVGMSWLAIVSAVSLIVAAMTWVGTRERS